MSESTGYKHENRSGSETQEKNISLDGLVRSGEWEHLGDSEDYRNMTREGRILTMGKAINERRYQLSGVFLKVVANDTELALKYLPKLRRLDFLTNWLNHSLVWEERGEIEDHPIPSELQGRF